MKKSSKSNSAPKASKPTTHALKTGFLPGATGPVPKKSGSATTIPKRSAKKY